MQWYTRRDGVIRGPFNADEISRYLILGRIRMDDELSQDRFTWATANRCTELLPDELQKLSSWDDYQQLVIGRMQVDERKGERRCRQCSNQSGGYRDRRRQADRRARDNDRLVSQYLFGHPLSSSSHTTPRNNVRKLLLTLLLATIVFAWLVPSQR
jgi:hypothetical protein